MTEELIWMILLVASVPPLVALFIVLSVLFPQIIGRTRQVAEETAGRSFALGLVNGVFLGALVVALFAVAEQAGNDALSLLGLFVLALLTTGVTIGLAGMVQLIGGRLAPAESALRRTVIGAIALILACLTPFVGWFGLLPYLAMHGLGAFITARLRRP